MSTFDADGYAQFLAAKTPKPSTVGIEPGPMPAHLFDFAAECVRFALRLGRAGIYLDTGLSKTRIQMEWCKQAAAASNGWALQFAPLCVARQFEREGRSLGYDIRVIRAQSEAAPGINVINYDRLDRIDPAAFGAVALDEADIISNFAGATSKTLKAMFADHRFKLCATATPAPNDPTEIAEHAEFLGIMPHHEVLMRWFINDTNDTGVWRLKGHAVKPFYDWMASWSRMAESPADLGFDGSRFVLQPFRVVRHKIDAGVSRPMDGLFAGPVSATGMHAVKRETAAARARECAAVVHREPDEQWLIWCDVDAEADALLRELPEATEIRGPHTAERKEAAIAAFQEGSARILITKPSIAGAGVNLQNCARVIYVGRSFSYRQWYQSVRRCWRFGQKREVHVHLIVAEGEAEIGRVIDRKSDSHVAMKAAMRAAMLRDIGVEAQRLVKYEPKHKGRLPSWLTA
jgi:hypothetical protein